MSSSDSTVRFVHSIGLIIPHGTRGLVLSVAQATCVQTVQIFPDLCTWSQQISTQKCIGVHDHMRTGECCTLVQHSVSNPAWIQWRFLLSNFTIQEEIRMTYMIECHYWIEWDRKNKPLFLLWGRKRENPGNKGEEKCLPFHLRMTTMLNSIMKYGHKTINSQLQAKQTLYYMYSNK